MAITNKDIEKLKEVFATKEDLNQLRSEVLGSQDKVMKKLEDISLEQKLAYSQYKRQDEKIEDHTKRIGVLELKV